MQKLQLHGRALKFCLMAAGGLVLAAAPAHATPVYAFTGTIPIPVTSYNTTGNFVGYDLSIFDEISQLYYLTDRSNNGIDVFSAKTNSYVTQLGAGAFAGNTVSSGNAGPNGISISTLGNGNRLLLAGNGPSNFLAFTLAPDGKTQIGATRTISTAVPGTPTPPNRVDGINYAPNANTILAANNASNPGFITLIDNATNLVIRSLKLDGTNGAPNVGDNGVEGTIFNSARGTFFVAVPALTPTATDSGGAIEVDPRTGAILNTYDFNALGLGAGGSCSPTGIAQGTGATMFVACSNASTQTLLLDPAGTGKLTVIPGVSGSDGMAFDPTRNVAFQTARYQPGGPVLGIIDGTNNQLVQGLPITYNSHSVAVDPISGEVFVAFDATTSKGTDPFCAAGCVGVFAPVTQPVPEPASWPIVMAGLLGMVALRSPWLKLNKPTPTR